jgi:hypothetical protein
MSDALNSVNPIVCQHLPAKLHLRNKWITIFSFYKIQFSHVYESSSVFFSSKYCPCVETIVQKQPKEHLMLGLTFSFQQQDER